MTIDQHFRALGRIANKNKSPFIAEAVAYHSENKEVSRGNGIFIHRKFPLIGALEYLRT